MRVYTVHLPRGARAAERAVLVKEGFSWPAFFFTVLWALWHRLWIVAAGLFAAELLLGLALELLAVPALSGLAISIGFQALVGMHANDLRRWTLDRRGWRMRAVVTGRRRTEAERRYLDAWAAGAVA